MNADTTTSAGNRKAAIWATEFFTTEIARSAWPFDASTTPTAFSTALPASATSTRPANSFEIPSARTAGSSAWMNQSDTKAAPAPERARIAIETFIGTTGAGGAGSIVLSERRYGTTQSV